MAPPSVALTGPLKECVLLGMNLTFDVAYPLAVKLCEDVSDYNGVFLHACERFKALWDVLLDKETDVSYAERVKALLPQFIEEFNEFWAFVGTLQPQKTLVLRLAAIRVTMDRIIEFHKALDAMLVEFSPELAEKMSRWHERNDDDWDQQQARMKQMLSEARAMCDGLTDDGAVELLTLLKYEIEYHPDENKSSPRMLMLREAIDRLTFTFNMLVGDVPEWFIPAYEVQYTDEPLDEGTYGTACRGTYMHAKAMIKRMMEDTSAGRKQFFTEATIWKELKHGHVIQLFGICHVSKPSFFVCEDVEKGNFANYFKIETNRRSMWRLFFEASLGMDYLHSEKIVHGNLKGNNLLIAVDNKARVADFGFAFHRSASKALSKKAQAEGVRWKAPECLRGDEENPSFKSDVYTFGLCIIEAFTNEAPWTSANDDDITTAAFEYRSHDRPEGMNDSIWSLVERMICSVPGDRLSMAEVCEQLKQLAALEARQNKCAGCEAPLDVGDKFCSDCGHEVVDNEIGP